MTLVEVDTALLADLHWMAQRYVDGVTSALNAHTLTLVDLKVPLYREEWRITPSRKATPSRKDIKNE